MVPGLQFRNKPIAQDLNTSREIIAGGSSPFSTSLAGDCILPTEANVENILFSMAHVPIETLVRETEISYGNRSFAS